MVIKDFLDELKEKDIELSFSEGRLKYSGPEEHITPEIIEKLKFHKGKLIKYLWPGELGNLMPINPEGSKPPLFLVHGDNGNYLLSNHLGPDQPVYGFFHPGSEGEAIKYRNVREMAGDYLEKVLAIRPKGPYFFAGFSFGGVIAFEMALMLQKRGENVPFLVLIDSISPLAKEPIRWQTNVYRFVRSNLLRPVKMEFIRLSKLAVCHFYLIRKKPIPASRRNYYMIDKYHQLNKRYKPGKFNGDILLFRTIDNWSSFKYLGWDEITNAIKFVTLEADHTTLFDTETSSKVLKNKFAEYLSEAFSHLLMRHELY